MTAFWNESGNGYAMAYTGFGIIICIFYAAAAWLVSRRLPKRISVKDMTRLQYMSWKRKAASSPLQKDLERAGTPFGMNAWKLQLGRYVIFAFWIGNGLIETAWLGFEVSGWPSLLLKLWGPVTWLLLTNTKASLVTMLIAKGKEMHDGEKNRELRQAEGLYGPDQAVTQQSAPGV